jgi:hypothetical protein
LFIQKCEHHGRFLSCKRGFANQIRAIAQLCLLPTQSVVATNYLGILLKGEFVAVQIFEIHFDWRFGGWAIAHGPPFTLRWYNFPPGRLAALPCWTRGNHASGALRQKRQQPITSQRLEVLGVSFPQLGPQAAHVGERFEPV